MHSDYIVVGGGIVGCSLAFGLLKAGKTVTVLDGEDNALRASHGNFGLVWLSSKGLDAPHYAAWTRRSISLWQQLVFELETLTEENLHYVQTGGCDFHFSEQTLQEKMDQYQQLEKALGTAQPVEVWDRERLVEEEPMIGPDVVGAIFGAEDGHVNPLKLLKAYSKAIHQLGGQRLIGQSVSDIQSMNSSGYEVVTESGQRFQSEKVVVSAGLGALKLAPKVGFMTPVKPQRGQVLITEKLAPVLPRPSGLVRQVNEGGIQIGDSKEWVGFDDADTVTVTAAIAQRAIAIYPFLADVQLLRSWGALRIVTDDGLPIYQQSQSHPGVYLVTCHSGITLAAAHSYLLPSWLEHTANSPDLELFSESRFKVSPSAG